LPINHLSRMLVSWQGLPRGFLHALFYQHLIVAGNGRQASSSGHFHCAEKIAQAVLPCRIHAVFHTDKICCEPLTEWLHFADLRDGQPDYMVYLVRTIQALGVLVNSVCMELAAAHQPFKPAARNKQLTDGIPYMLRNNRSVLCCQSGTAGPQHRTAANAADKTAL